MRRPWPESPVLRPDRQSSARAPGFRCPARALRRKWQFRPGRTERESARGWFVNGGTGEIPFCQAPFLTQRARCRKPDGPICDCAWLVDYRRRATLHTHLSVSWFGSRVSLRRPDSYRSGSNSEHRKCPTQEFVASQADRDSAK